MLTALLLAAALGATPTTVSGPATWFDATRHGQSTSYTRAGIRYYVAAGPALRRAMGGSFYRVTRPVRVCGQGGRCLTAYVTDWCSCHGSARKGDERVADLSPELFAALGTPLGHGVQRVTITPLVPGPGPWETQPTRGTHAPTRHRALRRRPRARSAGRG